MSTWQWITTHPAEAALAALGLTTSIAIAIRAAIPLLRKLAELTATRVDDDFIAKLAPRLDQAIAVLDLLRRSMPRVVVGPLLSTQPIATALQPRPSMRPVSGAPPAPVTTLRPWPTVLTIPTESIITPVPPPPDKEGPTS